MWKSSVCVGVGVVRNSYCGWGYAYGLELTLDYGRALGIGQ